MQTKITPDGQQGAYHESRILAGVLAASMNGVIAYQSVRDATGTIIDFQILRYNQVAVQMLALPPDAVGQTLLTLFPDVKPVGLFDQYVQVVEQGYPVHLETPYNAGVVNGWFEIRVEKMDDGFVIVFQDITTRKTAEQQAGQLRSILDGSINSIMSLKAIRSATGEITDFDILTANRAAEEYLNVSLADMQGRRLLDLFPENRIMGLFSMYVQTIETGQPQRMEAHYDQNGDDYWLDESATPYGHDALVVTFLDRTVEKKTRQALETSVQELKRSNDNLEQFAYVASHDLQEPLRKVQSFGDILADQFMAELGETGTDIVRRMQSAAARMSILIRDILAYSRLTTQQLPFAPLNLNPIVQGVLDDLETSIQDKRAVVRIEPMPKRFSGDSGQLRQLFQNLLTNALKFTRPGVTPEINITCDKKRGAELDGLVPPAQARKEFYCIQIIDNGIGFDPNQADRIFQVFQRLHGRNEYQGTGIGLAIVQKVIDNHRGYIRADGRPGAGATFTVAIPVR